MQEVRPFTAELETYFVHSLVGQGGVENAVLTVELDAYSPQDAAPLDPTLRTIESFRTDDQAEAAAYYIDKVGPHLLEAFARQEEFLQKVESSVVAFIADRLAPLFLPRVGGIDPDTLQSAHFICERRLFNQPFGQFLRPVLYARLPNSRCCKTLIDVITHPIWTWTQKADHIDKYYGKNSPLLTLEALTLAKVQQLGDKGKHLGRLCLLKETLGLNRLPSLRSFF